MADPMPFPALLDASGWNITPALLEKPDGSKTDALSVEIFHTAGMTRLHLSLGFAREIAQDMLREAKAAPGMNRGVLAARLEAGTVEGGAGAVLLG